MAHPQTPILYQSIDRSVILLDIPASIETAQCSALRIHSASPLQQPYPSTEPKGAKLAQALALLGEDSREYERQLQFDITHALTTLKAQHKGESSWCLPRWDHSIGESSPFPLVHNAARSTHGSPPRVLSPRADGNFFTGIADLYGSVTINGADGATLIGVDGTSFIVPEKATFLLSSIQAGSPTFQAACEVFNQNFDVVLMDPPWSNRSVRHGKAYSTREDQLADPFKQVVPVVKSCLSAIGIVAIWVTNKATVQNQVQRCMTDLGLSLSEEWIWVKITSRGEPILPLDGVWRKPYEKCLLFRRDATRAHPNRRLIFGVPDIHSRKPSLHPLLKDLYPENSRSLELFARGLTASWWSWGDEVLKFQDSRLWRARGQHTDGGLN
jgi:N6-adenosine-specific RNA methylase IME4